MLWRDDDCKEVCNSVAIRCFSSASVMMISYWWSRRVGLMSLMMRGWAMHWDAMHHSYVTFANIYYMTGADPTDNRIMLWCRYLWCMLASVVMFKYKYKCLNIHLGYHKKCKLPSLSTQTTPLLWRQGIRYNLISKNQYQIYPPKHPTFNRKKKQRKASRKTNQSPNLT